jgi:antitoxin PrlF
MATTVTVKGQVTLPKSVREAAGIKPGDKVEARATASGAVVIEKARPSEPYGARVDRLAARGLMKGTTTEELMRLTRGDRALDPAPKRR